MNILLLGSGAREHALAWKINQSGGLDKLYVAPGNSGTSEIGENVNLDILDFKEVGDFCIKQNISYLVVGPEEPLVKGISDYFQKQKSLKNICIIGPQSKGAMLEGSKAFSKEFMKRHHIPTARYLSISKDNLQEGLSFLEELQSPYVLKADGLTAGKGVLILDDLQEAKNELNSMLAGKFGNASQTVVIEEFLSGIELSVFVITDGESYKILPEAKDYKRIGEGDTGLNTGGMGAVSPVNFATADFMEKVEKKVIQPTISGLKKEDISYKGFIFFGLINVGGEPFVIEYNCRMGDPETEVVMLRLKSDIIELFEGVAQNNLSERHILIDERSAGTVILASKGYPQVYEKGKKITIEANKKDTLVFHAGIKFNGDKLQTNGGRVMAVSSYGGSLKQALESSYEVIENIDFDGKTYRKDIGFDIL